MSSDPEALRRSVCSIVLDTRFGDYGNRTWMGSAEAIADAVIPLIREAVLAEALAVLPQAKRTSREDPPDPWAWGWNSALDHMVDALMTLHPDPSSADLEVSP